MIDIYSLIDKEKDRIRANQPLSQKNDAPTTPGSGIAENIPPCTGFLTGEDLENFYTEQLSTLAGSGLWELDDSGRLIRSDTFMKLFIGEDRENFYKRQQTK